MIDEVSDSKLKESLDELIIQKNTEYLNKSKQFKNGEFYEIYLHDDDFRTIKVQLRALGLIKKSSKTRSVKDIGTYWSLTPFGDEAMTRLRAIKK